MKKQDRLAVAGMSLLIIAGSGAIAHASTRSDDHGGRYRVELPEEASASQRAVVAAMQSDAPIPVIDRAGKPRGHVRDSALTVRDDRVMAALVAGFREPTAPYDEEYERLGEALRVLDPVPVVDGGGKTVGYFTSHFLPVEEHEEAVADARATVAELLKR